MCLLSSSSSTSCSLSTSLVTWSLPPVVSSIAILIWSAPSVAGRSSLPSSSSGPLVPTESVVSGVASAAGVGGS